MIDGGTFEHNVIGGSVVGAGGTTGGSLYQAGTANLTINGGTFLSDVAGGLYFCERSLSDLAVLDVGAGNTAVNMIITGGTFNGFVYGGNFSIRDDVYSTGTRVEGNIHLQINADSKGEKIVFNSNVVAGSRHQGVVDGNILVTLSGNGSNLHFAEGKTLSGGCGNDGHYSGGKVYTMVTGDRTLQFTGFNGDLGARVGMFNVVEMTGSTATLTGQNSQLYDVDIWILDNSSLSGNFGVLNGGKFFTGDTLNLTGYKDGDTVFDAESASQIADWTAFSSVMINGKATELIDGAWCAAEANLKLGLDETDSTKLVISSYTA